MKGNRQVKEPIRKIEMKDGTVRYRLVVDIGRDENGKQQQLTRTFDKLKDARAELSRIRHETDEGIYVKPSDITGNQTVAPSPSSSRRVGSLVEEGRHAERRAWPAPTTRPGPGDTSRSRWAHTRRMVRAAS